MTGFQEDFLQTIVNVGWQTSYIGIYGKLTTGNNSVNPSGAINVIVGGVNYDVFGGQRLPGTSSGAARKITEGDLAASPPLDFGLSAIEILPTFADWASSLNGAIFLKVPNPPISIRIIATPTGLSVSDVWVATMKGSFLDVPIKLLFHQIGFSFPNLIDLKTMGEADHSHTFTVDPKTLKLTG